jgi:hypothetical protein
MELGSIEHKNLLKKGIYQVAKKTIFISLGLAIFLNIPIIVRENTFSQGLSYTGIAILIVGTIYALTIAFNKYRQVILPFDKQHNQ